MGFGGIDIYNKPFSENEKAKWWKHVVGKQMNEIVYGNIPDGVFYCEQVNSQSDSSRQFMNSFHYDTSSTMIKSSSDLKSIKPLDVIKWRDEFWIVNDVQKTPVKSQLQYSRRPSYVYYLSLRSETNG